MEHGLLQRWGWGKPLTIEDLSQPDRLQARFEELVELGVVRASEADRLALFAFAVYCRRMARAGKVRNACALFNARLRSPDRYGRTWRHKPSTVDEDRARASIRRLDEPAAVEPMEAAVGPSGPRGGGLLRRLGPAAVRRLAASVFCDDPIARELVELATETGGELPASCREALESRLMELRDARRMDAPRLADHDSRLPARAVGSSRSGR